MLRKKVLLIGDFGVGKTSLIRRYIDNTFSDKYHTTIGVKISRKTLTINNIECEMLIWDIEGATPAKSIPHSYFKGASGAIFVCDISRGQTINDINDHIDNFLSINPDAKFVTAYNKVDLLNMRQKEALLEKLPDKEFLTSAKENENVSNLFETLAKEMVL